MIEQKNDLHLKKRSIIELDIGLILGKYIYFPCYVIIIII